MDNNDGAFDVFLSHNSRDKPAVSDLATVLRERGLIVWLDIDELRPGMPWQPLLEAGIRESRSVAVLIGSDGLGPWQDEETQAALTLAVKLKRPVIPCLLPDAPVEPELPLFLGNRTWVDLRPALDVDKIDRLVWGITDEKPPDKRTKPGPRTDPLQAAQPLDSGENPFNPWDPAVPPRFFGRERLLRRLGEALDQRRSVSLVGDWRIGKSSVLATWAQLARQRGRTVRELSGEKREGVSCDGFVEATTEMAFEHIEPDEAADVIAGWIDESPAGLPPLILIDEAERTLAHLPHCFFERLRGMLGRVCLVLATRKEIADIPRDDKLSSPLLNRLELQRQGLLEEEGVTGVIGLSANLLLPSDGALMREWAGRHPFYPSLLGHFLWDARRHGESDADALEEFHENAYPRLSELWQTLSEQERRALWDLYHGHAVTDVPLKRRGLTHDTLAFGKVLTAWLATQR